MGDSSLCPAGTDRVSIPSPPLSPLPVDSESGRKKLPLITSEVKLREDEVGVQREKKSPGFHPVLQPLCVGISEQRVAEGREITCDDFAAQRFWLHWGPNTLLLVQESSSPEQEG